jgi:hypothetical protein
MPQPREKITPETVNSLRRRVGFSDGFALSPLSGGELRIALPDKSSGKNKPISPLRKGLKNWRRIALSQAKPLIFVKLVG